MRCASWKCAAVFKRPVRKTIPGRIAGPGTDSLAQRRKTDVRAGMECTIAEAAFLYYAGLYCYKR